MHACTRIQWAAEDRDAVKKKEEALASKLEHQEAVTRAKKQVRVRDRAG